VSAYHDARKLVPPATNRVLVALANGPVRFAPLQKLTGLKTGSLGMTLSRMERDGVVRNIERGLWSLAAAPAHDDALAWTRGL